MKGQAHYRTPILRFKLFVSNVENICNLLSYPSNAQKSMVKMIFHVFEKAIDILSELANSSSNLSKTTSDTSFEF